MKQISVILTSLLFSLPLYADGLDARNPSNPHVSVPEVQDVPSEYVDKRLPPVVPGQRVTAGGSEHKVISTSGPVPISPVPEIQQPRNHIDGAYNPGVSGAGIGSIGVIVDRDKD